MTIIGSTSSTSSSSSATGIGGTYGLSGSGIDVDSLVKKLMSGQQAKQDALVQKQTVVQWQKSAYNTVYDDLNTYRNSVFNYKLQATLMPNKVTTSNDSVATATANAGAAGINHSLTVSQLASGVNLTSSAPISTQPQTLGNLVTQMGLASSKFQFTITNGTLASQPISIDPSQDSINDVVNKINKAGVNVTASYDSTLDRLFLSTTNTGSSTGISLSSTADTNSTDYAAQFIDKLNLFSNPTAAVASNATVNYNGHSLQITNAGGQNEGTVTFAKAAVTAGVKAKTGTVDTTFSVTDGVDGTSLNGVKVAYSSSLTGTSADTALTSSWDAMSQTLTISGNLSSGGSADTNSKAITDAIQSGLTAAGFDVGNMSYSAGTLGTAAAFAGSSVTFSGGVTNIAGTDNLVVDENNGNLTIYLADNTAANNNVAKINDAVHALGSGTIDFSKYTFTDNGSWDGSTVGGDGVQAVGTLTGGTTPTVAARTDSSTGKTTTTYTSAPGKDAKFKLDDTELTESTNSFTISGVTYNLTGVTPGGSTATTISVTNDIDAAVANVQSFVDSYNKILTELNGDISQARYTDYPPLTDAQKASMSESDITLWNEKAKSGMLYNDQTLTSLVNTMRSAVSNPISGLSAPYNCAASLGITTGDYTEGGKLYLDTNKLKAALQANPNALYQIFGTAGTSTTDANGVTTTNTSTEGIAGRLYDGIKNSMDRLKLIAGTTASTSYDSSSNLAKEIASYTTQINDAKNQFSTMQTQYYNQYNAMEQAIQQLSSQSSWLSSMLSGG